jgi:hypothetical protein
MLVVKNTEEVKIAFKGAMDMTTSVNLRGVNQQFDKCQHAIDEATADKHMQRA